jgi:hypothetical protein
VLTCPGVLGLLWRSCSSPEAKSQTVDWILSVSITPTASRWASAFASAFDSVFGHRHVSWKCFFRSILATLACIAIVLFIWALVRPYQVSQLLSGENVFIEMLLIFIATSILNLIPDYISLLQTRYCVSLISRVQRTYAVLGLVVLNAALSAAIGAAVFLSFSVTALNYSLPEAGSLFFSQVLPLSAEKPGEPALGIWFYATFFTSVWFWLYVSSGLLVRGAHSIDYVWNLLRRFVNVREKPFTALGVLVIFLVSAFYVIGGLVMLIFSNS